jgi:glycosyltransferase involved in cell wall biosynthesis
LTRGGRVILNRRPVAAPTFSIVVPTYQRASMLEECLASIAAQTFGDFECIVSDDGSTDETPAVVAAWSARDARFRHHRLSNGGSPGRTRNLGAMTARAPWIAFLDDDDLWLPEKLQRQHDALRDAPEAVLIFGRMDRFGVETGPWPDPPAPARPDLRTLLLGNIVPCSTAVVRASEFRALGGFDETLRFAEDYELWMRLARRGTLVAMPDILVRYRCHAAGISRDEAQQVACMARILERARDAWGVAPSELAPLRRSVLRGRARVHEREHGFFAAIPRWLEAKLA